VRTLLATPFRKKKSEGEGEANVLRKGGGKRGLLVEEKKRRGKNTLLHPPDRGGRGCRKNTGGKRIRKDRLTS